MERLPVEYITTALCDRLCAQAARAPRGRTNHNFHEVADGYQRMLNVVQPGSYVRPHRHEAPAKSETFVVLRGEIAFFHFDEDGQVREVRRLGPHRAAVGVDLRPGVWHCFAALQPDTVVFEGKNGPYDPATDKSFAAWAPDEGEAAAERYFAELLALMPAEG
jgi:cupin fold WbuC family metalloprotein